MLKQSRNKIKKIIPKIKTSSSEGDTSVVSPRNKLGLKKRNRSRYTKEETEKFRGKLIEAFSLPEDTPMRFRLISASTLTRKEKQMDGTLVITKKNIAFFPTDDSKAIPIRHVKKIRTPKEEGEAQLTVLFKKEKKAPYQLNGMDENQVKRAKKLMREMVNKKTVDPSENNKKSTSVGNRLGENLPKLGDMKTVSSESILNSVSLSPSSSGSTSPVGGLSRSLGDDDSDDDGEPLSELSDLSGADEPSFGEDSAESFEDDIYHITDEDEDDQNERNIVVDEVVKEKEVPVKEQEAVKEVAIERAVASSNELKERSITPSIEKSTNTPDALSAPTKPVEKSGAPIIPIIGASVVVLLIAIFLYYFLLA